MQIFKDLEDAVLTRLSDIPIKTKDIYSGQLSVKDISEITINFPCIYLMTQGLDYTLGNRADTAKIKIDTIVGDRNLRGARKTVSGDISSLGVYAIMQMIFERLHSWRGNAMMTPLKLLKVEPLAYEESLNICIYNMTFEGDYYYVSI